MLVIDYGKEMSRACALRQAAEGLLSLGGWAYKVAADIRVAWQGEAAEAYLLKIDAFALRLRQDADDCMEDARNYMRRIMIMQEAEDEAVRILEDRGDVEVAHGASAQDMYAQDTYAQDMHAQDTYAQDMHAQDTYAQGMQAQGMQAQGTPSPEAYAPEAYAHDAFAHDAYAQDMHAQDMHAQGTPSPDASTPDAYAPDASAQDMPAFGEPEYD